MDIESLRYPVGHFEVPATITTGLLEEWIMEISAFPLKLRQALASIGERSLDNTYREGGWTIRQVVHHCADSHMNAFTRFKLALTEDWPVIKPYQEGRWAELSDGRTTDLAASVLMLEGIHRRWEILLRSLGESQWNRGYFHPEKNRQVYLGESCGQYAWHCRHHLAHIMLAAGK